MSNFIQTSAKSLVIRLSSYSKRTQKRDPDSSPLPDRPQSILVILLHGLGDAILCASSFRALRSRYPNARIDLATDERAKTFAELGHWFNHIYVIGNLGHRIHVKGWKALGTYVQAFRQLRPNHYDLSIDFYGDLASNFGAWLVHATYRLAHAHHGGARFLTHPVYPDPSHSHQSQYVLEISQALNLDAESRTTDIPISSHNPTAQSKSPYAVIAPGALHRTKQWPPHRFAGIAKWLVRQYKFNVLVLGSEKEQGIAEVVQQEAGVDIQNVAGQLPLPEVFAVIRDCALFVGNDSALAHTAAAFHRPLVQIFGPGKPEQFGYTAWGGEVCQWNQCKDWPCSLYVCTNKDGYCINKVTVDQVKQAVERVMVRYCGLSAS